MFKDKNILVIGMAKSGISAAKYLIKSGAKVFINDSKSELDLKDSIEKVKTIGDIKLILGRNLDKEECDSVDLVIVSPGVPLDTEYIKYFKEKNIEVISEIELAYRVSREKNIDFVGITGTNGKTTTTSIVGEIFKNANIETYIVGNIGSPAIEAFENAKENSVFVTELSSFQLEGIVDFKPKVCALLNISEDHLNRHHTMDNYINAKCNIFLNQEKEDFCILNYDDKELMKKVDGVKSKTVFFSRNKEPERGIFINDLNEIIIKHKGEKSKLMNVKDLSLPGAHNYENSMAAAAVAISYGIDKKYVVEVLKTFKAVEHRLEFVDEINGVKFVNDSKGTNPDSTIKAVQSYETPIILIAGGYDKGSDFNKLFKIAKKYVRTVIVLGETADLIAKTAKENSINEIIKVSTIEEAVNKSLEISNKDDVVLLSPACASWDMYSSYEERGKDFKNCVSKLKK